MSLKNRFMTPNAPARMFLQWKNPPALSRPAGHSRALRDVNITREFVSCLAGQDADDRRGDTQSKHRHQEPPGLANALVHSYLRC